jgi:hypothetical protein
MASVVDVLDGTAPIDLERLAELALERAILGARWLAGVIRDDGSFHYNYRPLADQYESANYSEVRHVGVTYGMYQLYEVCQDSELLVAAEAATRYTALSTVAVSPDGASYAFIRNGVAKLGGQALALVSLLERRRVLRDTEYDSLIDALARFLLTLESAEQAGLFAKSWTQSTNEQVFDPHVLFFPGENLLALVRLAARFPEGPFLAAAIRVADYLIHVRDGDLTKPEAPVKEDHWLAMALPELFRLHSNPDYVTVAYAQATSMIANQHQARHGEPDSIGATRRRQIRYTPIATKGEALAAVWGLAAYIGHTAAMEPIREAACRNSQFRMRVQFTEENTGGFARPDRLIGAWGGGPEDPDVRIDYIQHNIAALISLWRLVTTGDLAAAPHIR